MNVNVTPIITPVLNLLRSRKVMVALIGLLVSVLVSTFPDLREIRSELFIAINTLALALIGGIAWEDAAKHSRVEIASIETEPDAALRELIEAIVDEKLPRTAAPLPVPSNPASFVE